MPFSPPGDCGFTLLEIVIAVTILGIILTTVYGTLSRTIRTKEHTEERVQLSSVGREAVLRIADELEGALSPETTPGAVFQGVSTGSDEFADQVRFAISARPAFGPMAGMAGMGGRVLVTYSLDEADPSAQEFLLRRDQVPIRVVRSFDDTDTDTAADRDPGDEETEAKQQSLAMLVVDHVAGLRFRYLDGASRQWVEEWDSTAEDFLNRLPLAVEVALYLYDHQGAIEDFATIVDLPLANFGKPTPTPERGS